MQYPVRPLRARGCAWHSTCQPPFTLSLPSVLRAALEGWSLSLMVTSCLSATPKEFSFPRGRSFLSLAPNPFPLVERGGRRILLSGQWCTAGMRLALCGCRSRGPHLVNGPAELNLATAVFAARYCRSCHPPHRWKRTWGGGGQEPPSWCEFSTVCVARALSESNMYIWVAATPAGDCQCLIQYNADKCSPTKPH